MRELEGGGGGGGRGRIEGLWETWGKWGWVGVRGATAS